MTSRQRPLVFLLLAAVAISVGSIIFSLRQPSNEETADAVLPMPDADVSTAARTAMDDTMHGNMDVNVIANAKTPSTHGSNAQRDGHAIDLTDSNTEPLAHRTKILGFADVNYKEHAVRWYHRLTKLGYDEHVIVATDDGAASHFRSQGIQRFERSPYDTCVSLEDDKRRYRRQLFGRRWKYLVDTLKNGSHVLLTDVDNVFATYVPMSEFEQSEFDVIHAYSTSYPEDVFFEMGFTVCGGMGWYRASPKVRQFAGTLLNQCNCLKQVDCKCYCDDQVILNNILWKGKHEIAWDQPVNETPKQLGDWQWHSKTGTSSKTKHRVQIWNRTFAYRGPMPDKCFADTWVAMPLYVEKADVNKAWDQLCIANPSIA